MAKSKFVNANEKISEVVTSGYKKIENTTVKAYKKIENAFVERYLTQEGETADEAKQRIKNMNL